MNVRRIAIVPHKGKAEAEQIATALTEWARSRGVEVTDSDPELVVSLGGDGTMLRAAQQAHAADALLLGINLGRVGYLTEVDTGHEREALDSILEGSFSVEDRMMLACEVDTEGEHLSLVGLNEVLVERSSRHRLVDLEVAVGDERLASFGADGVLVATPTGSTAYALSAGGPIVSPRAECLVVVPVSAHMILARPFVFAPDESVTITVGDSSSEGATLVLDGAIERDIPPGCPVAVSRDPRPLRLVRLDGPDFIARLRMKLGLPG